MITLKEKNEDIFNNGHDGIVIPVNRIGVAGKGLALKAKEKFPLWYEYYRKCCENGLLDIEKWFFSVNDKFIIISFPTKNHWKEKSNLEYIEKQLYGFFEMVFHFDLHIVGIPALGCGLGGLEWDEVRRKIIKIYRNAECKPENISLYQPWT